MQLYDWVAEVVESQPLNDGTWRTIVHCRNRFYEGDTLELLSPQREVMPIKVANLHEVFFANAGEDSGASANVREDLGTSGSTSTNMGVYSRAKASMNSGANAPSENGKLADPSYTPSPNAAHERSLGEETNAVPVDIANKAMGTYAFTSPTELHRYDILRAKRRDPSRKN